MEPDLRQLITVHYPSLSQFANLAGVNKGTLSRVLSGNYNGNAANVLEQVRHQLTKDRHLNDAGPILHPAITLRDQHLNGRLMDIQALVNVVERHAPDVISGTLGLIAKELEEMKNLLGGNEEL